MKKLKSKKGITIISLVVTIVIILIITSVSVSNVKLNTEFKRLSLMYSDIEQLEDKIVFYYRQYGELPIGSKVTKVPSDIDNGHAFYEVNANKLSAVTLNLGSEEDIYIIDSETYEVYYKNGVSYKNVIYYTD